jgi:hypothetical protein
VPDKEATARIKINKLLEAAGWRFFADGDMPANIHLEPGVVIKTRDLDAVRSQLFETEIPLPPLTMQKAIVAEIEAEEALVAANPPRTDHPI